MGVTFPLRFTIVTPVLNGMPWLPAAVTSVARQQDGADLEVEHIVVDGGSTDGSREWLETHQDLGFACVFEPDHGQTDALITGFRRATGDLLAWLNADDMLEPGALRRIAAAFEANPDAVLVAGACLVMDADGRLQTLMPTPPVASFEGLLWNQANPPQPATFVTAEAYRRVGGLDPRYDLAMDVDLWLKVARIGRVMFLSDVVLARFRLHPKAKSVVGLTAAIREDFRIRRLHGMSLRSPAAYRLYSLGWMNPFLRPAKRTLQQVLRATMRRI